MNNTTQTITRHIVLAGRVQGVGFRYFTLNAAQKHSICGHVRNLQDGGVEVIAAGRSGSMELFLEQLRCGPPLSRVDRCDVQSEIPPELDLGEFAIH